MKLAAAGLISRSPITAEVGTESIPVFARITSLAAVPRDTQLDPWQIAGSETPPPVLPPPHPAIKTTSGNAINHILFNILFASLFHYNLKSKGSLPVFLKYGKAPTYPTFTPNPSAYGAGCVTVLPSNVTAVCDNSLPFTVAPVARVISV